MRGPYNVLVLCTGNSARSIMAEALFNMLGAGRVKAYSAGSHPAGWVNPFAVEQVRALGYSIENLRSKSWDQFAVLGAPEMDFVVTVCDSAAGEPCPLWPGNPIRMHWGVPDPSFVEGSEAQKRAAFAHTSRILRDRIERFLALPLETLSRAEIERKMRAIETEGRK